MNIFVGSLSFKTTEQELQREFEAFGEVDSVKIIVDQATLKSRGFAFVTMPNQEQAQAAIAALNGKEINGFTLKVNEARPRESRGPSRERTGGYGQGERSGYGHSDRGGYSQGDRGGYGHGQGDRGGAGYGGSFGGGRDRNSGVYDNRGNSIYDSKGRSGSGHDRKGRGGSGGRGSGGRSGGGRRSY